MAVQRTGRWSRWGLVALLVVVGFGVVPLLVVGLTDDGDAGPARDTSGASLRAGAQATASSAADALGGSASERARESAVFFGDSYFIGASPCCTDVSNSMAKLAGDRLGFDRISVTGGGGTGFATANPDYGIPAYLGQIRNGALRARDPDLVVIEGGSNDVAAPLKRVGKNTRRVLGLADRKHPDARLVLVGPLDVDGDLAETTPVHRVMKRAARAKGVPYVDCRRWLEGHYDLIGPDGIHPTPEGHVILGRKLARALRKLGV